MKCKKQVLFGIAVTLCTIFLLNNNSMAATAIVNTDTLKLRKEASTESTVLDLLNLGQKLEVIEQSGDWVKVKVNGVTGFVHKDYVKIEDEEPITQQKPQTEEPQEQNPETQVPEENTNPEENNPQENPQTNENEGFTISQETLTSNVEVYILPLINSTKIGTLNKGTNVIVMDETNKWLYIQAEEINGWVKKDLLNKEQGSDTQTPTTDTNTLETQIEEKVMYVNYSSIFVRKGPSTTEEVVDTLVLNNEVTVIAEVEDWYKVKIGNTEGYIAKRLLSNTKTSETSRSADEREEISSKVEEEQTVVNISKGEEIVNFAKQYLGCKYVYGGSGPSTFDCSGFTMYVYAQYGISLSHSATAQSNTGRYVAKEDLQPGDLVFFKDYETMDGIGHCGIYIGDGNFIHASSGEGYCVKISTLLSGSYNTRYETARRLF